MDDLSKYFLSDTKEAYKSKKYFQEILNLSLDFYSGKLRNNKVLQFKTPRDLMKIVGESLPKSHISLRNTLNVLKKIGNYSIAQFDDSFLAFPDSGNSVPGLGGSIFSSFLNQNMIAFDRSSPIGTFIEIQLIEWLRELIGYDKKSLTEYKNLNDVAGLWTSGGHMSNHIAILTALNHCFPEIKTKGVKSLDLQPVLIQAGDIAHYSHSDALSHLGIGSDNVISVDTSKDFTTECESLEKVLKNPKKGTKPFIVVAVAGNCRTCSIDNINEIADICEKYSVWFHVDACHGGCLIFSDRLKRQFLKGIERADSVSIDPHKGLFVPYPCSYILLKRRGELINYSRYPDSVLDGVTWNLGYLSPFFGSRGFNSLPMYLVIKTLGKDGIAQIIEERNEVTKKFGDTINNTKYFISFNDASFYRQVFVYVTPLIKAYLSEKNGDIDISQRRKIIALISSYTHRLNDSLYVDGSVVFDEFKLKDMGNRVGLGKEDKYVVMSWSIGNPYIDEASLDKCMKIVLQKAQSYELNMNAEFNAFFEHDGQVSTISETEIKNGPAGW